MPTVLPFAFSLRDPEAIFVAYLVAGVLFILGIRRLSSPATARSGNTIAAVGMAIALLFTLLNKDVSSFGLIVGGIVVGSVIGVASARMVKMTAMPQMVALFNGVGGGAVACIGVVEWHEAGDLLETVALVAIPLSILIGSISFAGSLIAFAKLQELVTGRPITFPGQQIVNGGLLGSAIALMILAWAGVGGMLPIWILFAVTLVLGAMTVLPIGGADMPVVISLLNSFTGLAAALAGFELDNQVLIIAGTLVGASGTLLTVMMGRAMNRSVFNVLFGAFGSTSSASGSGGGASGGTYKQGQAADAAILMAYARQVVIVPGYGLAVAQAQHALRELGDVLEKKGVTVKYAIHPVAGRMPGHMNVLLAEADVPYPQLYEMDDINPEFPRTDVALVVGANDVTNPSARDDPGSPIYGMPILEVDNAANVIVLKRSMSPGFAGIDNPLFYNPKTTMVFGDAKDSITEITSEIGTL